MPSRVKSPISSARLFNHQGQAAIEYVLLLVVSVAILTLLVTQLFTPLQNYLQSTIGDYTACLLETGALPSLGGDDTSAADLGCKMGQMASVGGSNSSGSKSNSSSSSSSDSSSSDKSSSSSSGSSSGSSSSSSSSSQTPSRGGRSSFLRQRRAAAGIGDSGANNKVTEIQVEQLGAGNGFFNTKIAASYGIQRQNKKSAVNMAGWTDAEKKKLERANDTGRTTSVATGDLGPAPKKIGVKPPPPKAAVEEEDKPFTIGNFIRYLFIAALIIALVIFIGGQALSMSKDAKN